MNLTRGTLGGRGDSVMRIGLFIAALCASFAGNVAAAAPADPFDEMLKVCAAKNPHGVAAAMSSLHATELSADRIDLIRLNWAWGLAVAQLDREQKDVQAIPQYWGWELGRAILLTATDPQKPQSWSCAVSAPYDRFDAAVEALTGVLAYGPSTKQRQFDNVRVVAWSTEQSAIIPDIMVVTADFGGDRKPTYVQFLSK